MRAVRPIPVTSRKPAPHVQSGGVKKKNKITIEIKVANSGVTDS